MLVALWIICGVVGLVILTIPAVHLWRMVRELGREVNRVSASLADASAQLEAVTRELPTRDSRA